MDLLEDFRSAYKAGGLVFFVGAGASFHSRAPSPIYFKERTSELFLPAGPTLERERNLVLNGASLPGSNFTGIQPELFYEHLLTLCPDVEVLGLWRALSRTWLARHGAALRPNANHVALARYAERTGLPVFTTNFDTLIEEAVPEPVERPANILLPGTAEEAQAAQSFATGGRDPGRLNLFKVHGSIMVGGAERLDSLATTMTSITARNRAALDALAGSLEGRRLVLLGYSGSDIDFFPSLLAMQLDPPFWFDPEQGGNAITTRHLERLGARPLPHDPAEVLADLEAILFARQPAIDFDRIFATLVAEMRASLTEAQKRLFLGMCLQSVGFNAEAKALFDGPISDVEHSLQLRDRILASLVRSRVADATSLYDQAERAAREAIAMLGETRSGFQSRSALKARALYHLEQARQQTIGPMMRLGDARVDWRPPARVLIKSLLRGLWVAAQLELLTLRARRRLRPTAGVHADPMEVRAVHVTNDHWVMMLGRLISAAGGLARRAPLSPIFRAASKWLMRRADNSGDFFGYAGAEKYLDRLRGRAQRDVLRTYQLLRDPLNFALACRDEAVEDLDRHVDKLSESTALFEKARASARACGSPATEIKALAGLVACGVDPLTQMKEIGRVSAAIEGAGYAAYRAFILSARSEDNPI